MHSLTRKKTCINPRYSNSTKIMNLSHIHVSQLLFTPPNCTICIKKIPKFMKFENPPSHINWWNAPNPRRRWGCTRRKISLPSPTRCVDSDKIPGFGYYIHTYLDTCNLFTHSLCLPRLNPLISSPLPPLDTLIFMQLLKMK